MTGYETSEQDDIEDEGVLDASDTLDGNPGDDPLDTGIIPADRWSAGMRFGSTGAEEEAGESLDQLLAEEEPDPALQIDNDENPDDDLEGRVRLSRSTTMRIRMTLRGTRTPG